MLLGMPSHRASLSPPRIEPHTATALVTPPPCNVRPLVARTTIDTYVVAALQARRRNEELRVPASVLRADAIAHTSKWALSRFVAVYAGTYAAQATYTASTYVRDACLCLPLFPSAVGRPASQPTAAPSPRRHWWSRRRAAAPVVVPVPQGSSSALSRTWVAVDTSLLMLLLLPNRGLEAGVTILLSSSGVLIAASAGTAGALLCLGGVRITLSRYPDAQTQQWLSELHWLLDIRRRVGDLLPWSTVSVPHED